VHFLSPYCVGVAALLVNALAASDQTLGADPLTAQSGTGSLDIADVRQALRAWEESAGVYEDTLQAGYALCSGLEAPLRGLADLREPVSLTDQVYEARSGNKFRHAHKGEGLSNGRVIPMAGDTAFDGTHSMQRRGDQILKREGRSREGRRPWPALLTGIYSLSRVFEVEESVTAKIAVHPVEDDLLEVTADFSWEGTSRQMQWVFRVRADRPYAVLDWKSYRMPERRLVTWTSDVQYHDLGSGFLYPVSGIQREYDANGDMYSQIQFTVDIEQTTIGQLKRSPQEVFRIVADDKDRVLEIPADPGESLPSGALS
jgi:hypothetical protein